MAADTNSVTIVGRLTRDTETRQAGATEIQSMRLASTSRRKVNGEWQDVPGYYDVTMFGGERVKQYLVKGKQLAITGRLSWREYEKSDGTKVQAVEIIAENLQLLGGGEQSSSPASDLPVSPAARPAAPDDSIPF